VVAEQLHYAVGVVGREVGGDRAEIHRAVNEQRVREVGDLRVDRLRDHVDPEGDL
jgi:hypothetical protein